jgi:spore maturation protein SpmB
MPPHGNSAPARFRDHQNITAFQQTAAAVKINIGVPVNFDMVCEQLQRIHQQGSSPPASAVFYSGSLPNRMQHGGDHMILTFLLLFLLGSAAGYGEALSAAAAERIRFCAETLIPSLFGCMAAANLLRGCGAAGWLGAHCKTLGKLLHLQGEALGIFLIAQLAGYPAGALLLREAVRGGRLTAADARRLSVFCFGGGPGFAVGFAGARLLGAAKAGWMMLLCGVAANFLLAFLLRGKTSAGEPVQNASVRLSADILNRAVGETVRAAAQICGTVVFCGMLLTLCGMLPLPLSPAGKAVLAACADITRLPAAVCCGLPYETLLPLCAGLLSFGGLCVQVQCLALGTDGIPALRLLGARALAALTAALLMRILLPFLPVPELAAVFSQRVSVSESGSVLPALMIFCTGFPFLLKKDWTN